jgi:signal transduction histidine kinase
VPTHWLVLLASLALTAAATTFVAVSTSGRDEARFQNAVQSATDRIIGRLDIYISTLRGAAALFAAEDVTADVFGRYVSRLDLERWHPGVQGIGWSPRLETGLPGEPDERYEIRYLEPPDVRNRRAMGYDMYSEERRREAMRRARDQGEPALSGQVTLVQEFGQQQQPGFLLYVPVYDGGGTPTTVAERRAHLLGFAYAPFRAQDLFDGIFGTEAAPRVRFSVYDGRAIEPDALLFATARAPDHRPNRTAVQPLIIAGRPWTVVFESQPEFEAASAQRLVPLVLLAGLLASAWLFALAIGQSRARRSAEQASRAKSSFLATMSHELRTPLNAIGGYVDLLQLGIAGPVTEQQQRFLERVNRAQLHLLALINDVLDFARIDAGRIDYRLASLRVRAAVADAVALVQLQADDKGVILSTRPGPDHAVLADPERLRQILLNLLSNAIKFTERGGRIEIGWREQNGRVEVSVTDTGIGIPADRLGIIFEPFLQVDGDLTRVRQGAGLGLAISRDLARGMGGEIRVASEPGEGSTFVLSLPGAAQVRRTGAGE